MEIQNLIYNISFSGNSYEIEFPEEYITEVQQENGVCQPLFAGSFLIKIYNMNFSCLKNITAILVDALDNLEDFNMEYDIEDLFSNFRDTIASYFLENITYDYCISSRDIELLSDLIAYQFYHAYKINKASDILPSVCEKIYQIQSFCIQIIEDKEYTPAIRSFIEETIIMLLYSFSNDSVIENYIIRSLEELFVIDVIQYMKAKTTLCQCKFCNKFFFKQKRNTEVYCPYPNVNKPYNKMSCREYHKKYPKYEDEISTKIMQAYKAQYKYIADKGLLSKNIFPLWFNELKKRERFARKEGSIKKLEDFINNTRFSKIGCDITDYSNY